MKPKEQNVAIAEFCGWKVINGCLRELKPDRNNEPEINQVAPLPNYTEDLNAMYGAEKTLTPFMRTAYADRLVDVLKLDFSDRTFSEIGILIGATAAQRAEAFLKTINKWKDQ